VLRVRCGAVAQRERLEYRRPRRADASSKLAADGNLVVGNADLNSPTSIPTNLLFEISPSKGVVATKQLDSGAPGALFGIVAAADSHGAPLIYFNDDNTNTVMVLSR
jgi:hypothetical protein